MAMAFTFIGTGPPCMCRCPQLLHRSAASLTAGRVSSARFSTSRRWGCAAAFPCAAAATAEKTRAAKGPKPGSDKDKRITPKSTDFSRWYLDVVRDAEMADYGPVRGTMVIRPYGYALWENVQGYLDRKFKELGVQNAYFPQLIPLSFLQREADHVEGFAPELALVTKGGGKDLEEPLVVRPTSETIVNHMLAQWIQSYRDLPLLLNQWANVHRWELRTRPFIRTLEFLWQEGHTAHATAQTAQRMVAMQAEEARAMARQMVDVYAEFACNAAAMPVIAGRKSRIESFAGANITYTIEAMMGDRRALQAGTSHDLGDNFAKAFGTQFLNEAGDLVHPQQSSWGASTRLIGGIIMTHGDDAGLRLPPRLAPIQVVIVPILKKNTDTEAVLKAADDLAVAASSAGIRAKVDAGTEKTPGFKFSFWEMKGVPVRIEVGPRDVEQGTCVAARRDRPGKEGKQFGIPLEAQGFVAAVQKLLGDVQEGLFADAAAFRDANIVDVASYDELRSAIEEGKWARGPWAGSDEDERRVKEETTATLRCIPFDQPASVGPCFLTGTPAEEVAIFAKAY